MTSSLAETAERVRDAVIGVPGVAGVHGGALGEVAVYLPGRTVTGVRLRDDLTDVHIVVRLDADLRETAAAVQRAVAEVRPGRVDVTVEDVAEPVDVLDTDELEAAEVDPLDLVDGAGTAPGVAGTRGGGPA